MRQVFRALLYFFLMSFTLWLLCTFFSVVIAFSYTDHILSWIPFALLGGWVPGKLYGITLLHIIVCIGISFSVIGFFDLKVALSDKTRRMLLLAIGALFAYEVIYNYFFKVNPPAEAGQFRQLALVQLSFVIGILIKAFNKNANME